MSNENIWDLGSPTVEKKTVLRMETPKEFLPRGKSNVAIAQRYHGPRGVVLKERDGNLLPRKTVGNQPLGGGGLWVPISHQKVNLQNRLKSSSGSSETPFYCEISPTKDFSIPEVFY